MEKKNTILLTVIAVATLLVAVVGATFAYYSVQVSNSHTPVNVNASAESIALLTLSTPTQNLYLNVLPSDMAKFDQDKSYFATKNQVVGNTESNYETEKKNHVISELSVGDNGDTNTKYVCKAQLKITLTTTTDSMGKALKSGDVKLYLSGTNVTIDESLESGVDLLTLFTADGEGDSKVKNYDITYEVDGATKTKASIAADIELINKSSTEGVQSYLAGKNLQMSFEVVTTGENLDCSIEKISGE